MEINTLTDGQATVMTLAGRIDSVTSPVLEKELPPLMETTSPLVVDLTDVAYVSSAGLRVLLKTAKVARAKGHRLLLAGLSSSVHEVFDISGFTALFEIHQDRPSAVAAA